MSDTQSVRELIEQRVAPVNSNHSGILQNPAANPNENGDLEPSPAKSPETENFQIAPPPPNRSLTLEERLERAHATARCQHVKTNGLRCGSPALRDEIYCYFHSNWRTQPDRRPFRPDPNAMVWELPILEDADGIQMALQLILNSVLANRMDLKRANLLLYGLQTAASNVKRLELDSYKVRNESSTELK